MGAKIKPVQPTVITDKAIIEQIVHEIHRRPLKTQLAKMKRQDKIIMSMIKRLPITIENGKRLFDIEIFNGNVPTSHFDCQINEYNDSKEYNLENVLYKKSH